MALLLSSAFAAWSWFRPYSWNPDPTARCKVVGVQLTEDRSFYWLETHLKVNPGQTHDLQKTVLLATASGQKLEPADTTFASADGQGTTEIWLKFWLEKSDLVGPLVLHLNDGKLIIKANEGSPALDGGKPKYFTSNHW